LCFIRILIFKPHRNQKHRTTSRPIKCTLNFLFKFPYFLFRYQDFLLILFLFLSSDSHITIHSVLDLLIGDRSSLSSYRSNYLMSFISRAFSYDKSMVLFYLICYAYFCYNELRNTFLASWFFWASSIFDFRYFSACFLLAASLGVMRFVPINVVVGSNSNIL
jgi:hypothetical protein